MEVNLPTRKGAIENAKLIHPKKKEKRDAFRQKEEEEKKEAGTCPTSTVRKGRNGKWCTKEGLSTKKEKGGQLNFRGKREKGQTNRNLERGMGGEEEATPIPF